MKNINNFIKEINKITGITEKKEFINKFINETEIGKFLIDEDTPIFIDRFNNIKYLKDSQILKIGK